MKTTQVLKLCATLLLSASCGPILASGITNNFDTAADYVANGILGDTNWDGVYLGFGDIQNGNPGGSGNGATLAATAATFPNTLSITETRGDWAGAGDDGFFLWKLVQGDFDVSVESLPTWATTANNFAGLLVRAYNTNNSGAPFSTTITNAAENWVMLWRGQEFNIDEVRFATNGADNERTFSDNVAGINDTRFFRIVRNQGTNFSFFWKTNATDNWVQLTNGANYPNGIYTRADLAGIPLQVGIAHALFSGNSAQVFFTDFELTGPNVNPPPAMPPAPSNVTFAPVNSNSVAISWSTNGGDGSLVVLRANGMLLGNPVQGHPYAGDTNFQSPNTFLSADRSHIVYSGPATNIIVTGLGGSNNTYSAYVFSSSGSGSSIAYNTASPATNSIAGPGIVAAVSFVVNPTNIPVGGAGLATITATYTSGDSYDVSSDASATVSSSDATIITVNNGVMTAVTNGTVSIVVGYAGFFATNNVSAHLPVFTDNFGNNVDYVANGLQGSAWDGVFMKFGDVPGGNVGADNVAGQTFILNANIQVTNALYYQGSGGSWRLNGDDGMYLFKVVTGDFQASVHVVNDTILNNYAGIMARLFNGSGTASDGGPGGAGGNETHINWGNPQQGVTSARRTIDAGGTTTVGGLATDRWFLMERVNSTNFLFFEKANASDPWSAVPAATMTLPEAANNAPMELGLFQEMRAANTGFAQFDTLMIDGPGITPPATPPPPATNTTVTLNSDLSMTFNWVAASASGAPIRSMLVMRAGGPVTAAPTLAQAGSIGGIASPVNFGTGLNLGGGNWMVFATGNPAASTNVSVTVAGLTPGAVYYATVYTFTGVGATKAFNTVVPPTGATAAQQDGILQTVSVFPVPSIPLGGVQIPQVIGIFGGSPVNVSAFSTWIVANPAIVQVGTNSGALSGMSVGSTFATNIYSGFTNVVQVTVRPATFRDEFNVNQDYLNNRTTNSTWDGVYLNHGDIPETGYTTAAPGQTLLADANFTGAGLLTVTQSFGGWAADQNDGFFLFKYVPGDFQIAVHIANTNNLGGNFAYNEAGLLARLYTAGTNGTDIGAPFVLGNSTNNDGNAEFNGETWVGFTKFDEFGFGTYARKNIDNKEYQFTQTPQGSPDNWLLIFRQNFTNFYFFERATNTAPWILTPGKTSFSGASGALSDFAGQPMQVGIQLTPYLVGPWGAQFEHFMLDVESGAILSIQISGGNAVISWPLLPGTLQRTASLSPVNWQPVGVTPAYANGFYSVTLPLSQATSSFFRLVQ
jgi:hypothetical protein